MSTPKQVRRARRDAIIRFAFASGRFSQRFLAEAFDLTRSHIQEILSQRSDDARPETPRRRLD